MKEIQLNKGFVALVDDEDFEYLNQWKWSSCFNGYTTYAVRCKNVLGDKSTIAMHRIIMNTPKGIYVDHKDHNGLNNQKYNLRNCTRSQNQQNRTASGGCKYLGVCWDKTRNKWRVTIQIRDMHRRKKHFFLDDIKLKSKQPRLMI